MIKLTCMIEEGSLEAAAKALSEFSSEVTVEMASTMATKKKMVATEGTRRAFYQHAPRSSTLIRKVNKHDTKNKASIESITLAPKGIVMRASEIGKLLPSIGWAVSSCAHALSLLEKSGRIKKVSVGKYQVLQTRGTAAMLP